MKSLFFLLYTSYYLLTKKYDGVLRDSPELGVETSFTLIFCLFNVVPSLVFLSIIIPFSLKIGEFITVSIFILLAYLIHSKINKPKLFKKIVTEELQKRKWAPYKFRLIALAHIILSFGYFVLAVYLYPILTHLRS